MIPVGQMGDDELSALAASLPSDDPADRTRTVWRIVAARHRCDRLGIPYRHLVSDT